MHTFILPLSNQSFLLFFSLASNGCQEEEKDCRGAEARDSLLKTLKIRRI